MLRRNLIANSISQVFIIVLGIIFIPLYIKYLGVEAYGLVGFYSMLQAWLSIFDMGVTPMLGREMARFTAGIHTPQSIRNLVRSVEIIVISIAFILAIALWLSSVWISTEWLQIQSFTVAEVANIIAIMGVIIGLKFCEGVYRSAIIGLQEQVWISLINAGLQILRYVGAIVMLAQVSPTVECFFIWQLFVSFLTLIVFQVKLNTSLPAAAKKATFSKQSLVSVWRFAGGMVGITFLSLLLTQVDKLLLSHVLGLEQYSYYMIATTLSGAIPLMIGPITQAIYPRLVHLHANNDTQELVIAFHKGAQLVTIITAPAVLILSLFPENVIYIWSGDAGLAKVVAPILRILVIGSFLNGLMWIPYQTQLAYGWTNLTIRVNTLAVVVLVPAVLLLVPIYGVNGAAWIWLSLNIFYVSIAAHLMFRKILNEEKWKWYLNDILKPVIVGLIVIYMLENIVTLEYFNGSRINMLIILSIYVVCLYLFMYLSCNQARIRRLFTMAQDKYFD